MKKFKAAIIIFICALSGNAQDAAFTQFYANPLYLNPAFAGSARCPRINLNYRNQWPAIAGNFVTYSASYDQHVDLLKGGLGLLVVSDKSGQGTLNMSSYSGIYAYQLNITRKLSLKAGVQGSYVQKSIDRSKLTFGDMIDDRRGFIYNSSEQINTLKQSYFDASAGLLAYSQNYFFGFAANHLTEPDEEFLQQAAEARLPRKFTAHAGTVIDIQKDIFSISPNILYQQQKEFKQINVGLYINRGPLVAGLWYRNKDAFIGLVGIEYKSIKFGYSYDMTVSKLSNQTAGSHELSFAFQAECKTKKKKFRTLNCPTF